MGRIIVWALPILSLLASCGQSSDSLKFYQAARRQYALDNQAIAIFSRGPTWDGANDSLTAKSNLDSISKSFVSLYNLADINGPLRGAYSSSLGQYGVRVQYTLTDNQSPVFSSYAGNDLSWNSKEFKAFMLYAHLSRVQKNVFDAIPYLQTLVTASPALFPLRGVAATPGDVLNTAFGYSSGSVPTINFYQHNQKVGLEKLNMADEADAPYHEFGHYIQNLYNPTLMAMSVSSPSSGSVINPDLDAVMEGTADYLSMAITKSERIHVYLENNMPLIQAGQVVRVGEQNRSYSKSWGFPETYIFDSHLDGRVIASSVNDMRKYLSKQDVTIRNCTPVGSASCLVNMGVTVSDVSDMWIKAFEISMQAFENLTPQSTYWDYAAKLIDEAQAFMTSEGCSGACSTKVATDLRRIFSARGLMPADDSVLITSAYTSSDIGSDNTKTIQTAASFSFVPFAISNGLSNDDNKLSECEIAMVMPDLYNNSAVVTPATDFYNIYFKIKSSLRLQEVKDASGAVLEPLSGANERWKFWGILSPGYRGVNNLVGTDPAWFRSVNGSHFGMVGSLSNFPVNWGYMVTVPRNSAGSAINITWQVVLTPKSSKTNLTSSSFEFTQSLTVDDTITFCN